MLWGYPRLPLPSTRPLLDGSLGEKEPGFPCAAWGSREGCGDLAISSPVWGPMGRGERGGGERGGHEMVWGVEGHTQGRGDDGNVGSSGRGGGVDPSRVGRVSRVAGATAASAAAHQLSLTCVGSHGGERGEGGGRAQRT